MSLIWATRGRTWGFRFLRDGEYSDPLPEYANAFSGIEHERRVWRRVGETVALRFPDPLGRQDSAGRVIPHEFVALGSWADRIDSVEDGLRVLWPVVADEFARVWELPQPPSTNS